MDTPVKDDVLAGGDPNAVFSDVPKFDTLKWNPEGPASLQYMSLVALDCGDICGTGCEQKRYTGKIKTSTENRKHRRKKGFEELRNDHKSLLNAVSSDDFARVRDLVQSGSDVNYSDERKRTPLHVSAAKGNVAILDLLLRHGADPNKKDILQNTPLHLAACVANIPVITRLLKFGAKVDALDNSRRSPLQLAKGRLRMMQKNWELSTHQFKFEMDQVIEMMKQYLLSSGSEASRVDVLCEQLHQTSNKQDIDGFNELLDEFTSLNITKDNCVGDLDT